MMNLRTVGMVAVISATGLAWAEGQPVDPPAAVTPADEISRVPALPRTPAAVGGLLYARPFILEHSYEFEWRAERPTVTAGWLLVLEVQPALVFPRQTAAPILYVGATTGERVNVGYESGRIVVIVPSELDNNGQVALDLSKATMWFGTPGLPEQVDAARVEAERTRAGAAQIAPFASETIEAARRQAEATLIVPTREALRRAAAELIRVHSPEETELVDSLVADADAVVQQPANAK